MTEKVSVIVPVYNVEKYLDECVESILSQTYRNLEIILVDDGSPDRCPAMCDIWASRDKRVRVIHKPNGGLSDARNAGIDACTGDYIMFVDSDDFIDRDAVAVLHDLLATTGADIACGGVYRFESGRLREVYNKIITSGCMQFSGIELLRNMLDSSVDCSAWGKLYRRTVIGAHRFIKGRYNEDVIFLFPLYAECAKVVYTDRRISYYRATPGSVTSALSQKSMHHLQNALEMQAMADEWNLPVRKEMLNYMCRTCLELGYAIQRAGAASDFPEEAGFVKRHVVREFGYMLRSRFYNWRDIAHALILVARL